MICGSWGPESKGAAIVVTFDNYGEAFDQQRGRWPADQSPGTHLTALETVPKLLDLLGRHALPVTWFVEGCNAALYPAQLQAMQRAGHEIALHGWRHETWADQAPADRPQLMQNSMAALQNIGITPAGFRPPGGVVSPDTSAIMQALGMSYISPLGTEFSMDGTVGCYPFQWPDVDALYFEPWLDTARQRVLGNADLKSLDDWAHTLDNVIARTMQQKGCTVLVLHPYLLHAPDRMQVFAHFLARLTAEADIWTPRMIDLHHWFAARYRSVRSDTT